MVFQAIVIIRDEERITMNTATQRAVDSEKKIWMQPVLTQLEVGETAAGPKNHPCATDNYGAQAAVCSSS